MNTQQIVRVGPPELDVTDHSLAERWDDKQKALIHRTVAKDSTGEEFMLFLNVAAHLNLNPLTGEVWCVKTRGENGSEGRIAIIVGEQGRLKIANRYDDYRGYRADWVCENDRYVKLADPKPVPGVENAWTYVEHSYSKPAERGEVVGAWCEVYRDGRPAVYFFAPWDEYFPADASERAKKFIPWFKQGGRMIVKCAISTGFRMAFNLAGIYGPEEMDSVAQREPGSVESVADGIEWGNSQETAEWMKSLFAAANNAKPGAYPNARIRLMLAGITDEERERTIESELVSFIEANGGTVPVPGDEVVRDDEIEVEPDDDPGRPLASDEGEPEADDAETIPGVE